MSDFDIPRKKSERIAPEFPLAARSIRCDALEAQSEIVPSNLLRVFIVLIVSVIFIPVSPSGTGNMFILFIWTLLLSRAFAADIIMPKKVCPLITIRITSHIQDRRAL